MLYKTMVLELLQERPEQMARLKSQQQFGVALEHYSTIFRTLHQTWRQHLLTTTPATNRQAIDSLALEYALRELQTLLPSESPPPDSDPLSLEQTMAWLRAHTPPG